MMGKLHLLAKAIVSEISKHRPSSNVTAGIVNTVGKFQEKLGNGQGNITTKTDLISKEIDHDKVTARYANTSSLQINNPMPQRIIIWWQWYQQLTGMDKVDICRAQVISSQEKLFTYQEERRLLNREATLMNNKLNEIYGELVQTKRDDPKYVQLTILENKSLQDQARIVKKLSLLEREERDCFTHLTTAIKEYHDSQTMNAQKYKYLSILVSALMAMISLIGSMIYNNRRITGIISTIEEAQETNENLINTGILSLQKVFDDRISKVLKAVEFQGVQNQQPVPKSEEAPTNSYSLWSYLTIPHINLGKISRVIISTAGLLVGKSIFW